LFSIPLFVLLGIDFKLRKKTRLFLIEDKELKEKMYVILSLKKMATSTGID